MRAANNTRAAATCPRFIRLHRDFVCLALLTIKIKSSSTNSTPWRNLNRVGALRYCSPSTDPYEVRFRTETDTNRNLGTDPPFIFHQICPRHACSQGGLQYGTVHTFVSRATLCSRSKQRVTCSRTSLDGHTTNWDNMLNPANVSPMTTSQLP
jgi:hypothetical protein